MKKKKNVDENTKIKNKKRKKENTNKKTGVAICTK